MTHHAQWLIVWTARIAFRGFCLSLWNPFYRAYASNFPEDVEKSYLREQQEALDNGKKIFTVVEIDKGPRTLSTKAAKQVVGFAIWNFAGKQVREMVPIHVDLANLEGK